MNHKKYKQSLYNRETNAMMYFTLVKQGTIYLPENEDYLAYDGWLLSGCSQYITEVKIRDNYSSKDIDRLGGAFLEHTKVREIKRQTTRETHFLYFNFFSDEVRVYHLPIDPQMYTFYKKNLRTDAYYQERKKDKWVTNLTGEFLTDKISYR